jgi:peptidoglycan/xylan/chitin deacetylase (PgdA/CDA1 family)
MNRRSAIRNSLLVAGGAAAGVAGTKGYEAYQARYPLPYYEGPAASIHADRKTPPKHPRTPVIWSVDTAKKLIALTFDDGPMPQWTPDVLTILAEAKARATFFLIGRNLRDHGEILAGKTAGHEFGNHTWAHEDLGRMDYAAAFDALHSTHVQMAQTLGREPEIFRPPYGHLAGASLLAAADLGYDTILWSLQMLESDYASRPEGLVDYIVDAAQPGAIVLAHDTGPEDRLVAIHGLPAMIQRLQGKGFEFVTVSELLREA